MFTLLNKILQSIRKVSRYFSKDQTSEILHINQKEKHQFYCKNLIQKQLVFGLSFQPRSNKAETKSKSR